MWLNTKQLQFSTIPGRLCIRFTSVLMNLTIHPITHLWGQTLMLDEKARLPDAHLNSSQRCSFHSDLAQRKVYKATSMRTLISELVQWSTIIFGSGSDWNTWIWMMEDKFGWIIWQYIVYIHGSVCRWVFFVFFGGK